VAITDLDEQLLVRAHQAGDEHAFGQIVRSQHRALYAHAYRRLGSHEAAEDAVQDTLLRAYRALPSFDGDLRLRAWLHRILTNVCHDESNRRKRAAGLIDKLEAQPVELAPDPIEETVLHDTVRVMNEALGELPESYREALVLRYVDGLSFKEVGDATGISEENARARVHRGRVALHKILSRVTVMLAFLVPGLRRTQRALEASGSDAVSTATTAEPAISLTTRLATHVSTAAPVLDRVATEGGALVAAKSSVVATTVAAVAAVSAPVVAYQVYDTAKAPERPPAAVAAPADAEDIVPPAPDDVTIADAVETAEAVAEGTTTIPPASTTTTEPPSASEPFAPTDIVGDDDADGGTTTTSTPPTTEAPPATATVTGSIGGTSFTVTGSRPDFHVDGAVVLDGDGEGAEPVDGNLAGPMYVADVVGGDAGAELELVLADGSTYRVRFRGTVSSEQVEEGATTWMLTGRYTIPGGEALDVAEDGEAIVTFRYVEGGASSLVLELQGTRTAE